MPIYCWRKIFRKWILADPRDLVCAPLPTHNLNVGDGFRMWLSRGGVSNGINFASAGTAVSTLKLGYEGAGAQRSKVDL